MDWVGRTLGVAIITVHATVLANSLPLSFLAAIPTDISLPKTRQIEAQGKYSNGMFHSMSSFLGIWGRGALSQFLWGVFIEEKNAKGAQ